MRFYLVFLIIFISKILDAQDDFSFPMLSPDAFIQQKVGFTEITVEYERPAVRERIIFGELVPWNKVWRTGAGHCTKISFSEDVIIKGAAIKAGKYALLSIPNEQEWMIILNSDTTLYGSYDYDSEKDIARFFVIPENSSRFYESFTIDIDVIPNNAIVYLSWANTSINFEVETNADKKVNDFIQNFLVSNKHREAGKYAEAAEYLLLKNEDLMIARKLAQKAKELQPDDAYASRMLIEICIRLRDYEQALTAVKEAKNMTEVKDFENEKDRRWELDYWDSFEKNIKRLMDQ